MTNKSERTWKKTNTLADEVIWGINSGDKVWCIIAPIVRYIACTYIFNNKRAKMALDRSAEFFLDYPFFVAFREEFTGISLCLYSASSPHIY